ncbi:carbohydrate ABC transporter permease [Nocardioides panacihumi]|uniref:Carbohydrate ABC transporter permease n=1 Tax=Nocardioides panacihumi TaxID=400774 RepID=A0ABN2RKZ3_9ACTN
MSDTVVRQAPQAPATSSKHRSVASPARARRRVRLSSIGAHALLVLAALWLAGPFVWQVLTSLKSLTEATSVPPTWLPQNPQWGNYGTSLHGGVPLTAMLVNSVLSTVLRTIGQVLFCAMAAYAFARLRFPGRNVLFALYLSVLMVPAQLLLAPQYDLMLHFGLLNTLPALILPGMFGVFGTFLLRQFFAGLPADLEEAARLDGASTGRIFWSIMLPLARPGLVALGLLTIIQSWNDLLWPLVVNTDPAKMTLPVGLAYLQSLFPTNYPVLMAGSLVAVLPLIIVFVGMQRRVLEGIALSGAKG